MAKQLTRGERNIVWVEEYCYIPEGKFVGQKVKLTTKQKRWIKSIYDTPTRTFILSVGRKNGKTALIACMVLNHLIGPEQVQNGEIYSAANERDQAHMIRSNHQLCKSDHV